MFDLNNNKIVVILKLENQFFANFDVLTLCGLFSLAGSLLPISNWNVGICAVARDYTQHNDSDISQLCFVTLL